MPPCQRMTEVSIFQAGVIVQEIMVPEATMP